MCWQYEPHSFKGLLSYTSVLTKLLKRGIAKSCLWAVLSKSCNHQVNASFHSQVKRRYQAGFPLWMLSCVAENVLVSLKSPRNKMKEMKHQHTRTTFIPDIQKVLLNFKKVAQKDEQALTHGTCFLASRRGSTEKVHAAKIRMRSNSLKVGVLWSTEYLSCGRCYISQMGQCIDDRLREHLYSLRGSICSHLAEQCKECNCKPMLAEYAGLGKYLEQCEREIFEVLAIHKRGENCVSLLWLLHHCNEIVCLYSTWHSIIKGDRLRLCLFVLAIICLYSLY